MSDRPDWCGWLTARPIAHRGLHAQDRGIVENSLGAAEAAIARKFAIECDVQLTADGEALVFHDYTLERLTHAAGAVAERTAAEAGALPFRNSAGTPPTLPAFLDAIAGRTPLVIEIKSDFSGDTRLAARTAEIVAQRSHPVALKSFDPHIMTFLRANAATLGIAHMPLGMVAEANYDHPEWSRLDARLRQNLSQFLHWEDTRPDFLSWNITDLPHATPHLLRKALGLPVMTWTVRTAAQRENAARWADQIVFEETQGLRVE
ncbi:MAG: glycerophosphodiester phosphodiesterase family protein [Beijerinckiaceae bacterium]